MSDIKPIVDENKAMFFGSKEMFAPNKEKHSKRIYLGGKSRPWGLHQTDVFNLDYYLAATILNGLRILMSEGHHYYDAEMELVADKLEFYITDFSDVIDEHIDFSHDKPDPADILEDFEDWLDFTDRPGQQESYDKWLIVEEMQAVYIREAMEWLGKNWGKLWD